MEKISDLFGEKVTKEVTSKYSTTFTVKNKTGEGNITEYNIFPGIKVLYSNFHLSECFKNKEKIYRNAIEINHCREGRCECTFEDKRMIYLGEKDLSISSLEKESISHCFPISHYHGISIIIDVEEGIETIQNISKIFGNLEIDIKKIEITTKNKICILRANESIEHIFSELYNAPENLKKNYLALKIIELLLFLNTIDIEKNVEQKYYLNKFKVELIKRIEMYIEKNIAENLTIKNLSSSFNIPETTLKLNFKIVYGTSISNYIRNLRMQLATNLLRETNKTISEICQTVGYYNQTNFTRAFQKIYNKTPSDYRKIFVHNE